MTSPHSGEAGVRLPGEAERVHTEWMHTERMHTERMHSDR